VSRILKKLAEKAQQSAVQTPVDAMDASPATSAAK
jgi:hypothetical protein